MRGSAGVSGHLALLIAQSTEPKHHYVAVADSRTMPEVQRFKALAASFGMQLVDETFAASPFACLDGPPSQALRQSMSDPALHSYESTPDGQVRIQAISHTGWTLNNCLESDSESESLCSEDDVHTFAGSASLSSSPGRVGNE